MPVVYAETIEEIIRGDVLTKPAGIEKLVIDRLRIDSVQKLTDFPSAKPLKQKAFYVRQKIRKERGCR